MKKKILSMLLSMVLTVACFTGCGSNPSSGGETGGAASTETPKNPEDMYTEYISSSYNLCYPVRKNWIWSL